MEPHGHHQQYERLGAAATTRPLPRWGIALLALFLGPLAFLLRGARQELWDGGDHLLIVDNHAYSERYRRIRYQDIEVIQSWRSSDYLPALVLLGLGGAAYLALSAWLAREGALDGIGAGPPALFGLCLMLAALVHALRGPTSRVRVRTRVQTLDLPALGRQRVAARVLPLLRERILAVQESDPFPQTPPAPAPAPSSAAAPAAAAPPDPEPSPSPDVTPG